MDEETFSDRNRTILMKHILLIPLLVLASCASMGNAAPIVASLAKVALDGVAAKYGVPPALTNALVDEATAQLQGMSAQAYAYQPPAQGSSIPALGAAVAKQLPSNVPLPVQAVLLDDAAAKLQAMQTK